MYISFTPFNLYTLCKHVPSWVSGLVDSKSWTWFTIMPYTITHEWSQNDVGYGRAVQVWDLKCDTTKRVCCTSGDEQTQEVECYESSILEVKTDVFYFS